VSPLRVACVGTGFIAGRHLAALSCFDDVAVVAVADAVPERAREVAARYGARAYDDGAALLKEEELDAVWLCVPPFAHGPLELSAVERGLPFFVEKPLSVELPVATAVARAVSASGLLTGVGYHWRSLSVVDQARSLIGEAPVELLTGSWFDSTPAAAWWSRRDRSGGQLVEQTTHLVDLARLLGGEVESVTALETRSTRTAWPQADVPTASAVLLRFASGAVGTLASSCVLDRRHQVQLQVVVEGRTLDLRESALSDHELRTATAGGEQVVRTTEDPIAREDRAFLDALLGRVEQALVPYDEALRTHAVVCAADRSARAGGDRVVVADLLADSAELGGGAARG
jgi:myo-inositol 2-dehydrogenase/D-chiro-inositol 1-dehydrogenase